MLLPYIVFEASHALPGGATHAVQGPSSDDPVELKVPGLHTDVSSAAKMLAEVSQSDETLNVNDPVLQHTRGIISTLRLCALAGTTLQVPVLLTPSRIVNATLKAKHSTSAGHTGTGSCQPQAESLSPTYSEPEFRTVTGTQAGNLNTRTILPAGVQLQVYYYYYVGSIVIPGYYYAEPRAPPFSDDCALRPMGIPL